MSVLRYILFSFLIVIIFTEGFSNNPPPVTVGKVIEGDTLLFMDLPQVDIIAPRVFKNRFEEFRYNRLVRNVKKVYPFARLAGLKFEEYSQMLENIPRESDRRRAMKQAEYELRLQFEDDLRGLTFSQGLILLKLVDRETSHTSYELLKEFRGNVSAVFWQSFGRVFGFNLRTRYDPKGRMPL
jgi:hypothetical protein